MTAQIGDISCTFVKGSSTDDQSRVRIWRAPGMSGFGAHKVGAGENRFEFEAVFYSEEHYVEAWFTSIEALRGTVVTIVDDYNKSHTNCLILDTGRRLKTPRSGGSIGRKTITGVRL